METADLAHTQRNVVKADVGNVSLEVLLGCIRVAWLVIAEEELSAAGFRKVSLLAKLPETKTGS